MDGLGILVGFWWAGTGQESCCQSGSGVVTFSCFADISDSSVFCC